MEKETVICPNVRARENSDEVVEEVDGLEEMLDNVFIGTFTGANDGLSASIHEDRESDCLPNKFQNLWDDA